MSFVLKKIKIDGYKNLREFEVDFIACQNHLVLIGNNGSGKSNLLEATSSIFATLFNLKKKRLKPGFSYNLDYKINDTEIHIEYNSVDHKYSFQKNNATISQAAFKNELDQLLPKQVLCSYSGEEQRIWTEFYEPFYNAFRKEIRKGNIQGTPDQSLFYINKYYWDIALLTYIYAIEYNRHLGLDDKVSELTSFVQNDLQVENISDIKFTFDQPRIRDYEDDVLMNLVNAINPEKEKTITLQPDKFFEKEIVTREDGSDKEIVRLDFGDPQNFFKLLAACFMPKPGKLIKDLEICFGENRNLSSLSEGEKKILLVRCILEYLADENTLVLLDEPDSHIHITRKRKLKDLLKTYQNRSIILTTHSPTLSHCFDTNHIYLIEREEDGTTALKDYSNQEILENLTDGIWTFGDQLTFATSRRNVLLVEGDTDEKHFLKALDLFKEDYPDFDFEVFETKSCSNLKQLMIGLASSKFVNNRIIIGLFDDDNEGEQGLKGSFKKRQEDPCIYDFTAAVANTSKFFGIKLPRTTGFNGKSFTVENLFASEKYRDAYMEAVEEKKEYFDGESISDLSGDIETKAKRRLADNSAHFSKEDFEGFKPVLELFQKVIE